MWLLHLGVGGSAFGIKWVEVGGDAKHLIFNIINNINIIIIINSPAITTTRNDLAQNVNTIKVEETCFKKGIFLKNRKKVGRLLLPGFKTYIKATVIREVVIA